MKNIDETNLQKQGFIISKSRNVISLNNIFRTITIQLFDIQSSLLCQSVWYAKECIHYVIIKPKDRNESKASAEFWG